MRRKIATIYDNLLQTIERKSTSYMGKCLVDQLCMRSKIKSKCDDDDVDDGGSKDEESKWPVKKKQ